MISRTERVEAVVDTAAAAAAAWIGRAPELLIASVVAVAPFLVHAVPNLSLPVAVGAGMLAFGARKSLAAGWRRRPLWGVGLALAAAGVAAWLRLTLPTHKGFGLALFAAAGAAGFLSAFASRRLLLAVFWISVVAVLWSATDVATLTRTWDPEGWLGAALRTTAFFWVLAATAGLAHGWRSRFVIEVASGAAVAYLVLRHCDPLPSLVSDRGFLVFRSFFTAGVIVAIVAAAARVARHLRRGEPDATASARFVTWAQVHPWISCGGLATAAVTLWFVRDLTQAGADDAFVFPPFTRPHGLLARRAYWWWVEQEQLLLPGLALVASATTAHLVLRSRSVFVRQVPYALAPMTAAAILAGESILSLAGRGTLPSMWHCLGMTLAFVVAVLTALPFANARRMPVALSLALLIVVWWCHWHLDVTGRQREWGTRILAAVLLPVLFHSVVASGARSARLAATVAAGLAIGAVLIVAPPRSDIDPGKVLLLGVHRIAGLVALVVLSTPFVLVARRARSLCAVPEDHPIVADHLGGHPPVRPFS